jgi:hypothetical protein
MSFLNGLFFDKIQKHPDQLDTLPKQSDYFIKSSVIINKGNLTDLLQQLLKFNRTLKVSIHYN